MLNLNRWKNEKDIMAGVVLLAICITISAVSAEGWSFDFSSSDSTNSNGGQVKFDNGKLNLQGIDFTIPDWYKENESAQKLAEDAEKVAKGAKMSMYSFLNGDKEIITKVYFSNDDKFDKINPTDDNNEEKTIAWHEGVYYPNMFGDNTPTFQFLKDGKIVEVNAPDDATLESVIK